jgi:hypothetical protein
MVGYGWLHTVWIGCWVIPFVLLVGLEPYRHGKKYGGGIVFLLLGVPALLIGWIFVYSFHGSSYYSCIIF